MALPTKHILSQGPVLASLGGTALSALSRRLQKGPPPPAPATPSAEIIERIAPLPADLIADYVRHVGGDAGAYRGVVPAHLFPQWGFPLAARTLRGVPYPMEKVLNGGCRLEVRGELPVGKPLVARARLVDIDDDGRRAVLHQQVVTGTEAEPDLVVGDLYAIVPLGSRGAKDAPKAGEKKPSARVPDDAIELAYWKLPANAGLAFAMLTGDFNPVHWVPAYARAFGFPNTILHGFSTMARAIEGLHKNLYAGGVRSIGVFDCRFTRPLVLPARVGLYVGPVAAAGAEGQARAVWVGAAPGGPAYLAGTFTPRPAR